MIDCFTLPPPPDCQLDTALNFSLCCHLVHVLTRLALPPDDYPPITTFHAAHRATTGMGIPVVLAIFVGLACSFIQSLGETALLQLSNTRPHDPAQVS